jgi:hypothetical protein
LFTARALEVYCDDQQAVSGHLTQAQRLHPHVDVEIPALIERRKADVLSGVASSAMHRIHFDRMMAQARGHVVAAVEAQAALWGHLSEPHPHVMALQKAAVDMDAARRAADALLAHLAADSPQVRRYRDD